MQPPASLPYKVVEAVNVALSSADRRARAQSAASVKGGDTFLPIGQDQSGNWVTDATLIEKSFFDMQARIERMERELFQAKKALTASANRGRGQGSPMALVPSGRGDGRGGRARGQQQQQQRGRGHYGGGRGGYVYGAGDDDEEQMQPDF